MSRRFTLVLFIVSLMLALAAAAFERVPGYMDAEYYYAGALLIVNGTGSREPYVWNYLNHPGALPVPSFAYWMPLTSLLAAAGMALAGTGSFWAARIGFILLAAAIPPLTGWMAFRLTGRADLARLAGILALFPGFYLAYQTTTDAFPLYMLLGSLFLIAAGGGTLAAGRGPERVRFFGLGLITGLLHMTRADGLLWLAGAGLAALDGLWRGRKDNPHLPLRVGIIRLAALIALVLAGYVLITLPWYLRNMQVWGSLLPPGGSRAIWITAYNQTMIYPATRLTIQHWLSAGWGEHLRAWMSALGNNLQTALSVQGSIVLFPFILIGLWKLRGQAMVRLGAAMWLVNLLVMTFIFPYAGGYGGFFHSGAALQPLLWAAAPLGMESAAGWYAQKRRLGSPRAFFRFISTTVVVVCVLLSAGLFFNRVIGTGTQSWAWNASDDRYRQVEAALRAYGADHAGAVLVNNPPGYWLASGRPALVIPDGDERTLIEVARKFQAGYLVFESNNPLQLADLYHGRVSPPELIYLTSIDDIRLYRFDWPAGE